MDEFLKFLGKWPDIAASVTSNLVSAFCVWVAARAFIKWRHAEQLRFEQAKRIQEAQFQDERSRELANKVEKERILRLVSERDNRARCAQISLPPIFLKPLRKDVISWMRDNDLLKSNPGFIAETEAFFRINEPIEEKIAGLANLIRSIKIPGEEPAPFDKSNST